MKITRLYNDKGIHVLSLVQRWDGTGHDFVKPDRPGTDDGDFIEVGVDKHFAEYVEKAQDATADTKELSW